MIAVAPHRMVLSPYKPYKDLRYYQIGVGYCFIHSKGNAKT